MISKIRPFGAILLVLMLIASCKKPAGPGGKASIKGKVYCKDFNTAAYGPPIAEYYGAGETVYICYGDNNAVANTVRTSTDGSYEFLYLRKGHYKIFTLSRDTSLHVAGANKTISVEVPIDISGLKQTVSVPDMIINK
jgi:hypothetical protein